MEKIAIIGMSCKFPESNNYHEFWDILKLGKDCIQEIDLKRWGKDYIISNSLSKWCGAIDDPFTFDNHFFGISPKEAKNMDPQQRLLLEETYHAIEDSGENIDFFSKKNTSVFVACMNTDYRENVCTSETVDAYSASGVFDCMLANRISYTFNLTGRSEIINVACASSLVAIHNACNSIKNGESDIAIVGAVNLNLNPFKYKSFSQARMLSPDGKCKTFDYKANGYVPGDGIAVLVMEKLSDAKIHNHKIYGVVLGSKVRHSGKTVSLTAPSIESQEKLLLNTWKTIDLDIDNLNYIETHGTGTSLGDPIEVEAIKKAFKKLGKKTHCYISSVKANIGHLEACAGMAGIIKVLLMMKHKMIPPSINLNKQNPIINLVESNLTINTKLIEWKSPQNYPNLVAAISSFGFGGAISHLVFESYDDSKNNISINFNKEQIMPFLLSAKTPESLIKLINEWKKLLENSKIDSNIYNYGYTLLKQQKNWEYKVGFSYSTKEELIQNLNKHINSCFKNTIKYSNSLFLPNEVNDTLHNYLYKTSIVYRQFYEKYLNEANKLHYDLNHLDKFLIRLLSLGKSLLTICNTINSIGGNKYGKYASIILSGVISLSDFLRNTKEGVPFTDFNLPNIKLNLINNYLIDVKESYSMYFTTLLNNKYEQNINVWFENFKENYNLLINTQFTFKNNIKSWEPIFRKYNLNFDEIFSENINIKPYTSQQQLLIILTIAYSWKKLNQKWGISIENISDNFINEISELLICEKLDKWFVADFLLNPLNFIQSKENDFVQFCMSFTNNNLVHLPTLRKICLEIWKIFLEKNMFSLEVNPQKDDLQISNYLNFDDQESLINQDGKWINFLIQLWLKGNKINFGEYLGCKLVSIPQYPFIKKSYSIKAIDCQDIDTTSPNFQQEKGPIEWIVNNPLIEDHIINDQILVPGSLILYKTLENKGLYKQISGNITFLKPFKLNDRKLYTFLDFEKLNFKWTKENQLLSTGRINTINDIKPENIKFNLLNASNIIKSETDIYPFFHNKGYKFGKNLKSVRNFWKEDNIYYAHISIPNTMQDSDLYLKRAILLDSIFQASILAGYNNYKEIFYNKFKSYIIVPFSIKNFCIYSDLIDAKFLLIKNIRLIKTLLEVDVYAYKNNETVAELKSISFTWMSKN